MGRYIAMAVLLGGYLPWRLGLEFLDAAVLVVYGCLSALFASPEQSVLWRAIGKAAMVGWGAALLLLVMGLVTVNITGWHGRLLLPPVAVLVSVAALSGAAATAVLWAGSVLIVVRLARRSRGPRARDNHP